MKMKFKNLLHRRVTAAEEGKNHPASFGTMYELWSCDTYAHETFLCDVFDNYDDAKKALDKGEESALAQDAEIRDTYWIVETDAAKIAEREQKEKEYYLACRKERSFNAKHLEKVCLRAIDNFVEFLRKNRDNPILEVRVGIKWDHPDDCFDSVEFELEWSEHFKVFFVAEWIWIRSSRHYMGGGISTIALRDETIGGLCKKFQDPIVREHLLNIARTLIQDHFTGERP